MKEIREGVISHPLVLHFWESHSGRRQEVLMRVVSRHLTALDRQITESVNILESGKVPEESLNSKNEWGGAKIPSLPVSSPKGVAKTTGNRKQSQETDVPEHLEDLRKAMARGQKRIRYREPDQANITLAQESSEPNPRKGRKGNTAREDSQEAG